MLIMIIMIQYHGNDDNDSMTIKMILIIMKLAQIWIWYLKKNGKTHIRAGIIKGICTTRANLI